MYKKKITYVLFFIYLALIIWSIIFKFSISFEDIPNHRSVNLIPFYYSEGKQFQFLECMFNVVVFAPIGGYLKMLNIKNIPIILFSFFLSLCLEISQFAFSLGVTDITDLITNTSGAIIGIIVFNICHVMLKENTNIRLQKIAMYCTLSLIVFFVGYFSIPR